MAMPLMLFSVASKKHLKNKWKVGQANTDPNNKKDYKDIQAHLATKGE
jgi:hypothetical protein